jgi:hypothetical protein
LQDLREKEVNSDMPRAPIRKKDPIKERPPEK